MGDILDWLKIKKTVVKVHYLLIFLNVYFVKYTEKSAQNKIYSSMIYPKADIHVIITQVKKYSLANIPETLIILPPNERPSAP